MSETRASALLYHLLLTCLFVDGIIQEPVYKWWEEEELPDGQKWRTLEHRGPMFPPEYEPLPKTVQLRYDGEPFPLEPASEEIAGFYAQMLRTDYPAKEVFNTVRGSCPFLTIIECWARC